MAELIRWFREISLQDIALVGGKNASLGEMHRELTPLGIKVPDGFAITARAYHLLLESTGIGPKLEALLQGMEGFDVAERARRGAAIRELFLGAALPKELERQTRRAYQALCERYGPKTDVAVRSSATAEDLPNASFAGQMESYLNVRGEEALLRTLRACYASLFTDRAISYRIDRGFAHQKVALSIGVQKMVRSDLAQSGVIFTLDTESGFRDVVLISAAYGLGENVVKGSVDPDEFYVFKPTLSTAKRPIIQRRLGSKQLRMVYTPEGCDNQEVSALEQGRFCLSDEEVLRLASYAVTIEQHYSRKRGQDTPLDIEWAKDGESGELFIVQARPETVQSRKRSDVLETYRLQQKGQFIVAGKSIGQKIGAGKVSVIHSISELGSFTPGDVLVADTTTPDWEPVMKKAKAIITNRGGRTCHAAIVARELGIPAVVGTGLATSKLTSGQEVTVVCAEGEVGHVYDGILPFGIEKIELSSLPRPKTKIQMNLGDPEQAFALSFLPNDGVGLARLEFIINEEIKAHPMALLHPERITNKSEREAIGTLTAGYPNKGEFFVDRLAQGVGTIAAAFYPKPVVVRLSDFKSNEYAALIGGAAFEPKEENPMIGLRGAARYTHPSYAEAFALECQAMRRVREEMGLTNVRLMIPFCRRVEEGERVLAEMAKHGLLRGKDGLEIYVMCEIPNNVIRIDAFCQIFDGISIGSNDLTQLTLGVDRDSELVAFDFDERDPGVLEMLRQAVDGAHRNQRHVGICGQAPSDYPEIAEYLVRLGIESLSLSPDTVVKTTLAILDVERAGKDPSIDGSLRNARQL